MTAKEKLADAIRRLPHIREFYLDAGLVACNNPPPDVDVWWKLLAAIPDVPPEEPYKCEAQREEGAVAARKVRIMKAMEDISAKNLTSIFRLAGDGHWYHVTELGCQKINDWYSPEPPLWEGEVWRHTSGAITELPQYPSGAWRKIKVREVR